MRYIKIYRWLIALALILTFSCAPRLVKEKPRYDYSKMDKATVKAHKKVEKFLESCIESKQPVRLSPAVRIDSLKLDQELKSLEIYFNRPFSYPAYRPDHVDALHEILREELGGKYKKYAVQMYSVGQPLHQLIPNVFRTDSSDYDLDRMPKLPVRRPTPLIRRISRPYRPEKGLLNRVIDVRPSHGWYYNQAIDRWEWQRPRLFQTVEDLLPYSFIVPYLLPMLENAGAIVFLPRERDIQTHEVIVDEDMPNAEREMRLLGNIQYEVKSLTDSAALGYSIYRESYNDSSRGWGNGIGRGFTPGLAPYPVNLNPFEQGSHRVVATESAPSAQAAYIPYIPETGEYAVYISYHSYPGSCSEVHYTVYHAGGQSEFLINQQIGGGTWIYLGTFKFFQGQAAESGQVIVSNESWTPGQLVSTDAVRFGGGMGDILRNGSTSGRPRFVEGSKYYLQYAGMPDTLIYNLNDDQNDYKDDYNSRSEYVNYLYGAPFGPQKNRQVKGLGIPFDLSLAFHTDAGITHNDTTIGTLAIYSSLGSDTLFVFPDSMSRMANRDWADVLQTQIVEDLRQKYDPAWNRRHVMDALYSESVRPNVPTMLLELLSHQNFHDMKFALDPRFRFDVARAIYKGMLKYIAFQNRSDYVVQPLPVDHLQAQFTGQSTVTLKWWAHIDSLEATAAPDRYLVYTRINDGGFDNGQVSDSTEITLSELLPGVIYSYKVTAVNDGGESMPSEILSVCWQGSGENPVLIVNGFDRICAPAWIDGEHFSGFTDFIDQGVPDRYTFNYTGRQIDFTPTSPYRSNDAPGHGASQAPYETRIIAGNTFDYPYAHGVSIANAGYSFVSCSDEAVMDGDVDLTQYRYLDLILGEEKETRWPTAAGDSLHGLSFKAIPAAMQEHLTRFLQTGGGLFISGSYIGSDLCANKKADHPDFAFAVKSLRFTRAASHACATGEVFATNAGFMPQGNRLTFNTQANKYIYSVEAPDAIDPIMGSRAILRYQENQFCAATAYKKSYTVVAFGFPFETILTQEARDQVMAAVLAFLQRDTAE
ncbi:fibronectin type III domain-containing protein [candidate division KSB1 bacterium]|nr:fibronectin type III domain-containing protein [candidate division KSB1 bacterium]